MKRERLLNESSTHKTQYKVRRLRLVESHGTPILNAAIDYASKGWRVLPVESGGKKPLIKDWPRRASNDPDRINEWWEKNPEANVGVLTGSDSGLFVLDVDTPHGGVDTLKRLEAKYVSLPETLRVTTGTGNHYYFRYPDNCEIKTNANLLGPGLDVRGVGGFVVAPPSIHQNGSVYKWDSSVISPDGDAVEAPDWLIKNCVRTNKQQPQTGAKDDDIFTEGHRNDSLTRLAGRMRNRRMSHKDIETELIEENIKRCNPPLSEEEVRSIADSIMRYELGVNQEYEAELKRLAALSVLEYEHQREGAAKQLGFRVTTLDKEVEDRKQGLAQVSTADEFIKGVMPWPEAVEGLTLANSLLDVLNRFVVLPLGADQALVLWTMGTYVYDAFRIYPKLCLNSPEKRCGKTTTLEVLGALVHRALLAANATPAVLFRSIDAWHPALLIDEGDTFIPANDELRGIINSGHTRGTAFVLRTEGDASNRVPKRFSTWAPMAIAMTKSPPDTLRDRSILIPLRRKMSDEKVVRMPFDLAEQCTELRQQCRRWADDHFQKLKDSTPDIPNVKNDRAMDNWFPLLAIADLLGDDWPASARESMRILEAVNNQDDESMGVLLLSDIRDIFDEEDNHKLSSNFIVEALVNLEEHPWGELKHGNALTKNSLARLLKPFKISPNTIKFRGKTLKGYKRNKFEDAFSRYLPHP